MVVVVAVADAVGFSKAVRLARTSRSSRVAVSAIFSVAVGLGTSVVVALGVEVAVAVAVRFTRSVRLTRTSRAMLASVAAILSIAVGLGTFVVVEVAVAVVVRCTRAVRLTRVSRSTLVAISAIFSVDVGLATSVAFGLTTGVRLIGVAVPVITTGVSRGASPTSRPSSVAPMLVAGRVLAGVSRMSRTAEAVSVGEIVTRSNSFVKPMGSS